MAELAVTAASAVGSAFSASSLASFTSTLLLAGAQGLAAGAIARAFDNSEFEGPRLSDLHIQASTEGAGVPLIYGRARVGGQVIWAARFKEVQTTEGGGGKGGGPTVTEYSYFASFAVALCEGE
ncbi:MAG: host specificity protein, partial [Caulobacterales bacterium]|nr:host specificity protein [Caulobacterales bacterium]